MPYRVKVQKENKEHSAVSQAGNIILVTNWLFKIPHQYHSNNRIELHSHSFIHFYCLIPASKNANHTGSFAQNFFQIDSINSLSTSKDLEFWLKIVKIICFLILKPIKGTLGFILEIMKKIARWRHKSEISKRNVKTMISPLLFRL